MHLPLPTPQMVLEARSQSKGLSLPMEILVFVAVFMVAGLTIQGTIQTVLILPALLNLPNLPAMQALMEQARQGQVDLNSQTVMALVTEILRDPWVMLGMLFSTVGLSAGVLIFCRGIERRSFASMGLRRGHLLREYLLGALVGLVLLSAAVGLCLATGAFRFNGLQAVSAGLLAVLLLFLLGFLLQGFSEELLCRGYFMVSLARRQSLLLAVVISSAAFSCLHLMNPGILEQPMAILNIFLFGALFGVYVLKRGDIWGAAAAHSLWNFAQGNIFGIQVSGTAGLPTLVLLDTPPAAVAPWASLINGGTFGLEGGLAVTLVLAIALVVVLLVPGRSQGDGRLCENASTRHSGLVPESKTAGQEITA